MKVLVTGATGFVGGRVARELRARGDEVRALVRRPDAFQHEEGVELALGDLRDPDSVRRASAGVDAVVHAAALLGDCGSKASFWDVNVLGTQLLLDAARNGSATTFVFIGSPSSLMSPDGGDQIGIDESTPYPARYWNHYAETKAVSEQHVLAANGPDLRTCSLRPRAVWGPGDQTGPIMRVLAKLRKGRLPDLAKGKTVLASLCYIDSLSQACLRALEAESSAGKAYFLADDEPVDLWEAIRDLARRFELEPPAKEIPELALNIGLAVTDAVWRLPWVAQRWEPPLSRYALALLTRSAVYDTSAAEKDLGHRPIVDHATGVSRFTAWVDEIGGLDHALRRLL